MKTKNIVMASILLVVAIVIGSLVATYFSYNNREIALRQQAEAQRGKIEGVHDKMWKIIQQKAQVTDEYKQTFEKIYPQLIAGRYQNDQGTMMKWIKESNPNFDVSLYRDLMQAIEIQRTEFQTSQERMLDIIREHETLTRTYSNEGDTILDNCMGSGTSAIAAIREKRNFIGFELNKEYYDKACKRIKLEQAQLTLF